MATKARRHPNIKYCVSVQHMILGKLPFAPIQPEEH